MRNIYKKFDSVSAFHAYLEKGEVQAAFKDSQESQREVAAYDNFYHTTSWAQAEKLFTYGDKETSEKLEGAGVRKQRLSTKLTNNRRQIRAAVCGFAPHVPNYIAGVPASMLDVRQVRVKEKVINVIYNISANGGVKAEDLLRTGVAMLSAIMKIEAGGVRVNLYTADISDSHTGQRIGWLCRIKNSAQHIDTLKMCYPLCNPSMLRRHSFRFTETTKGVSSSFASGYGGASRDIREMCEQFKINDCRNMSYYSAQGKTADQIADMILKGEC